MKSSGTIYKKSPLQVLCYVFLSIWAMSTIYPILWVIQNSFKAKDRILADSFALPLGDLFTTANYRKAFSNLDIAGAYKNSLFISGVVCVTVVLLAGMAAYAFSRYHFKGVGILYSLVVASMMFPVYATIIPVYSMETAWGITNTKSWILTMLSVILPQIAGNLAFAIIVLTGYIKGLPIELEEAAYMEGCSAFGIFFRVIMPLTKPSFATVAIFSFLWSYNDLFTQMFFLRRPEMRAITRLLNELTSQEGTNYGLMAAAVTLVVVPVIIVYIFLQKYIIKGMTAGAIKG
ncbi:MAG: carbohydrate ABC transporter permease [Lachnospiraceae bacterium]|nr:carbohydrate ABC transporter permease [Lachnospiraceae bacterium]